MNHKKSLFALIFGGIFAVTIFFAADTVFAQVFQPIATTDPNIIIGNIIKTFLSIIGSIALFIVFYGGIVWVTSAGKSDAISKGKDILSWGIIGLIFIFASYALVQQIFTAFPENQLGEPSDSEETGEISRDIKCEQWGGACEDLTCGNLEIDACIAQYELRNNAACQRGLCSGPTDRVCCGSFADAVCEPGSDGDSCGPGGRGICINQVCENPEDSYIDPSCQGKNPGEICDLSDIQYGLCDSDGRCVQSLPGVGTACQKVKGNSAQCYRNVNEAGLGGATDCESLTSSDRTLCGSGSICCVSECAGKSSGEDCTYQTGFLGLCTTQNTCAPSVPGIGTACQKYNGPTATCGPQPVTGAAELCNFDPNLCQGSTEVCCRPASELPPTT